MQSPRTWMGPLLLLLAAVFLIPMLWLLAARLLGFPSAASTDPLGLLATIGGVMGAIFTVGGLVIALVAVLTQLTLEDRAKRLLEDKYTNDLLPQLQQLMGRRIDAEFAWRQAEQIMSEGVRAANSPEMVVLTPQGLPYRWEEADALAQRALERYPEFPDVRRKLGLALGNGGAEQFLAARRIFDIFGGGYSPWQGAAKPDILRERAISWLEEALSHGEDSDGSVAAHLAVLYGARGDFDAMLEKVRQAIKAGEETRDWLRQPQQLPLLAAPCGSSRDRLARLGSILQKELPVSENDVQRSITHLAEEKRDGASLTWWVVGQRHVGLSLVALQITCMVTNDSVGLYAMYPVQGAQPMRIPQDQNASLPPQELSQKLSEQFLFLCPLG